MHAGEEETCILSSNALEKDNYFWSSDCMQEVVVIEKNLSKRIAQSLRVVTNETDKGF